MQEVFRPEGRRRVRVSPLRLAPLRHGRGVVSVRIEGEPEVKADEGRVRVLVRERAKLRQGSVRPGGHGRPNRGLQGAGIGREERVELPSRRRPIPAVVGTLGRPQPLGLAVVSKEDAQLESRRPALRGSRAGAGIVASANEGGADRDACRSEGGDAGERPNAGAGGHAHERSRGSKRAALLPFLDMAGQGGRRCYIR